MICFRPAVPFIHVGIVTMSHGITPLRAFTAAEFFTYKKTSATFVIFNQCGTDLSADSHSHITGIPRFSRPDLLLSAQVQHTQRLYPCHHSYKRYLSSSLFPANSKIRYIPFLPILIRSPVSWVTIPILFWQAKGLSIWFTITQSILKSKQLIKNDFFAGIDLCVRPAYNNGDRPPPWKVSPIPH